MPSIRWIYSSFIALALVGWADSARADLMTYSFHANYYRTYYRGSPEVNATLPTLAPNVPASWQQGSVAGLFSLDTDATPTGGNVGPDSAVYAKAYSVDIRSTTGIRATHTADI